MNIYSIENEIIEQLQDNITDLKTEAYPEKPSEYRLIHPKGAILVHFKGSHYDKPEEGNLIQQIISLNFSLTLMIKGLRDKNGAYTYISEIISVLTGFIPTNCGKMYPVNTDFLQEDGGVWKYSLNFTVPAENYGI